LVFFFAAFFLPFFAFLMIFLLVDFFRGFLTAAFFLVAAAIGADAIGIGVGCGTEGRIGAGCGFAG